MADKITAPVSAPELERVSGAKPSYKILAAGLGEKFRLACAELSDQAIKPGIDIFEAGVLLGSYDFEDQGECLSHLSKILRAHVWEKGRWKETDYKRYTVNWFERVLDLQKGDVAVDKNFSFFHTPTLIKCDGVDAIFALILEYFQKLSRNPDEQYRDRLAAIRAISDADARKERFNTMAERGVLQFLTIMKDLDLMDVASFSQKEAVRFKHESERTILRISRMLASAGEANGAAK